MRTIPLCLRWLKVIGATFLIIGTVLLVLPQLWRLTWIDEVAPNVRIGNVNLGGMSQSEVQLVVNRLWNTIHSEGIRFYIDNEFITVYPIVTAPGDPDLTYELMSFDSSYILIQAFNVGRERDFFTQLFFPYQSFFSKAIPIYTNITVDYERLEQLLYENFSHKVAQAKDARFSIINSHVGITPERKGYILDQEQLHDVVQDRLEQLSNEPIVLSIIIQDPAVIVQDIRPLVSDAHSFLIRAPFMFSIKYTSQDGQVFNWQEQLQASDVEQWIGAVKQEDKTITLAFNEGLDRYLEDVALKINRQPQDAKFEIDKQSGRITQFQTSQDGFVLNIQKSKKNIQQALLVNEENNSFLVVDIAKPQITTESANDLGIKEVVGVGQSNFSGSPNNRRTNIRVASNKLNGLLIAPGDTFSLVEALKPFTAEAGYVPELVIKGKRLVPEIGGGACQIGTTTFRAALNAGLAITERRNHSFAVSYYNDEYGLPGTDATIYDPAPDFRFVNDTGHHILLQTHVGDDDMLTYTFWGTRDGRNATTTKPTILASFPAPETKYIETNDLLPGETKCSGSNVPGYNTIFTYSVSYPDGTVTNEEFPSRYRPFQKICLVGVEALSVEGDNEDISTEAIGSE